MKQAKIAVIGGSKTSRTNVIRRLTEPKENPSDSEERKTTIDFAYHTYQVDGKEIKAMFWNLVGQTQDLSFSRMLFNTDSHKL